MVTLATNAFNKKLISEQLHDDILTLNNLLSTITHTNIRATKEEAKKSQSIIQSLLKINTSDNTVYYKWITSNLDTIINELKQPLSPATKDIIYNVYNAWRYRDGAAAVEMSTIFEEIIDNNLEILFMIFEDDQKQYEQFIHSIDTIFFTDFLGEGYDALCDKRIRFIKSLNIFSDNSQNAVHRQMAKALKDKINHTMIREIV
jgi:ribosomal protein L17